MTSKILFIILFSATLMTGCQKGSDNKDQPLTDPVSNTEAKIPEAVCSNELKKLTSSLIQNQKKLAGIFKQIESEGKASALNSEYRSGSEKQLELCEKIDEKFNQEKISGCLKSQNLKTKENSLYKDSFANTCKSIGLWTKQITKKENQFTKGDSVKSIGLNFSDKAMDLLKPQSSNAITYISNGQISSGKESFKTMVQSGQAVCMMTTVSETSDESKFKYLSDAADPSPVTDIGFEFNGSRSLITLQDENGTMQAMLCLNLKLGSAKKKKANLEKIFGSEITISEANDSKKLETITSNKDLSVDVKPAEAVKAVEAAAANALTVAPPIPVEVTAANVAKTVLPEVNSTVTNTIGTTKTAVAETIETFNKQAKDLVDHTVDKIDAAGTKKIQEIQTAAIVTSKAVVKNAIADAKVAVNDTINEQMAPVKKVIAVVTYVPRKIYGFVKWAFGLDDDDAKTAAAKTK
jgi:hypothetical protein